VAAARIGSVFGVVAGGALLGMILIAATAPLMPTYEARLGTAAALDDQRSAAALMWVTGMFTTLPLLVLAVWRWAAAEERIARRAEALTDAAALTSSASAGTTHNRRLS
jgi:putative membrane protein